MADFSASSPEYSEKGQALSNDLKGNGHRHVDDNRD